MPSLFKKPNKNLIVIGPNSDTNLSFAIDMGEDCTNAHTMKETLNTIGVTFVKPYKNDQTVTLWVRSYDSQIRHIDSNLNIYNKVFLVYQPNNTLSLSKANTMKEECDKLGIRVIAIAYAAVESSTTLPSRLDSISEAEDWVAVDNGDVQLTHTRLSPDYTLIPGQADATSQLKNNLLDNLDRSSQPTNHCTLL